MAVGDSYLVGMLSYVAIGRETTYGTYNTCTAGLNFLSWGAKSSKETKILEEVQTSRTLAQSISLGKTIEHEGEFYFSPMSPAANYLLQNAFGGGPVSSATGTGETTGGLGFEHTLNIANFSQTYSSLCMNVRKGDSGTGKIFEYNGLRVNEFSLMAEIDEALKASVVLIGKDSTVTTNDVSSSLSTLNQKALSFVNGRFSVESSVAGLTTTSFWHVQSMEFKLSNNLNSDAGRRIGSDVIDVLPPGLSTFELKCTMRFDTTTAFDAMMAATRLVAQFEFQGDTMTGSALREGIKMTFPNLRVMDAGDPEIGGPNEALTAEVSFAVLRDPTVGGYACRAVVTNLTSSYA